MLNHVTLGKRSLRLALCATVLGTALAAQTAHATVIAVDFTSNALSTVPFNIDGLYLNVVTGAATTTTFAGYDLNPYFAGTSTTTPTFRFFATGTTNAMVGVGTVDTALSVGTTIGSSSAFITGATNATQSVAGTNYFGFRFLNEGTGLTNYGYVTVQQLSSTLTAGSVKILGYAYENSGAAITISAVPEPSSALMMLGGLAAAGAFARRRLASRREETV